MVTQFMDDVITQLRDARQQSINDTEYTRRRYAHGEKVTELDREHVRVESEISAAFKSGDVNASAVVLPRREVIALMRKQSG